MEEKTYQTPCGTIHYWTNVSHSDEITLVFLPGLTADHRLFDKQIQYFENRYNVIVWDAPAHASSWPFRFDFDLFEDVFKRQAVVTGNARVQNARKEIIREENEKAQTE